MPTYHKVVQGEYLAQIALKYGFADPATIWNDSHNAPLKKKRKSPHVLLPGDVLFIPDKSNKQLSAATANRHKYLIGEKTVKLRLALKDWDGEPLKNLCCVLKVGPQVSKLTTGGAGEIEQEIPVTATEATLFIEDIGEEIPIKIGHLDPATEETGWKGRLRNLGYLTESEEADEDTLSCAIEEFQCNNKLSVDGKCGTQTVTKLESTHGC